MGSEITYLIAHDPLRLLVVERRDRESSLVLRVHGEVDIAEVRKFRVHRVWGDVLAGELLVGRRESPACARGSATGLIIVFFLMDHRMSVLHEPFSPICQCTHVNGIISSRPLSFRVINVRCAVIDSLNQH